MDKKLLGKTVLSCFFGAVLWCGIDYVICLVKDKSFADTFFTFQNLSELALCSIASGVAYYFAQKKKKNID